MVRDRAKTTIVTNKFVAAFLSTSLLQKQQISIQETFQFI